MEITLICKHETGQVALPAKRIGGYLAPERRYHIVDHKVTLSGHPDKVLKSDADELLSMPDGLYRMPTPKEQEQWARAEQEASQIQENTEQGEEDSDDFEDDEEVEEDTDEEASTVPPALEISPLALPRHEKPKRPYHRKKQ